MLRERRLSLVVSDAAKRRIVELGYEPAFGARPLARVIRRELQEPLAETLLRGGYAPGDSVRVDVVDEAFTFERG
jgi:ATP-dependent Clp protease ATP-binding subunit ClpB